MKTTKCDKCRVTSDEKPASAHEIHSRHASRVTRHVPAFTLIELLVVIVVIGVIAGFSIPALKMINRMKAISVARAEMSQLTTAIDGYKKAYGFYPPDNPNNPLVNQLYYELVGTTNTSPPGVTPMVFKTLDGSSQIDSGQLTTAFSPGVGGFVNCSKPGSGQDTLGAQNFIHELRPNQLGTFTANGVAITNFITAVGGPVSTYQPLGVPGLNPWRYKSSGTLTNNPGSYELWVQLVFGPGQTNLVCNWSKTVQINSPLP